MMRHQSTSLVRQVQDALRDGGMDRADRGRAVTELHKRVQRLRSLDEKFSSVAVSDHVEALQSFVKTA